MSCEADCRPLAADLAILSSVGLLKITVLLISILFVSDGCVSSIFNYSVFISHQGWRLYWRGLGAAFEHVLLAVLTQTSMAKALSRGVRIYTYFHRYISCHTGKV